MAPAPADGGREFGKGPKGGEGKGQETRTCYWCKKGGHRMEVCHSWLAGKPKAVASLEEDW